MPILGHFFDYGRYTLTFWIVAFLPPLGTVLWRALATSPNKSVSHLTQTFQPNP
jgi:hypothetical protein